ncbi:UPSTREAM OF FLC protein [Actinidia rufa]|uniref:UPSTREAM OF FLC protein n=1 Tax=Actinidia rufa TaxID=165716 RepID=A0A7J0HC73_9ERIC|nr:UPSTREAM OF FLC protein [Actinidia rufa]
MAVTSRGRTTELVISRKWKEKETSPERTKVWIEPPSRATPLHGGPSLLPEGLYLRDVINRLNFLRGKGMASMYSWSSKRSYKNGFVWHDLAESDFIYPAHGQEYVLKGSELFDGASIFKSDDNSLSSSFKKPPPEFQKSGDDCDFPSVTRQRNQSWSAIDLHEYRVYKAESTGESSEGRAAANAATQTDDKRRRGAGEHPETLETLMKADGRLVLVNDNRTAENHPSGRLRASSVLMQLISCGSISFKDCGPTYGKDSLISQYKARLPRGGGTNQVVKGAEEDAVETPPGFGGSLIPQVEGKAYFSGSLIETKKDEFPALKRSNSYNADRCV